MPSKGCLMCFSVSKATGCPSARMCGSIPGEPQERPVCPPCNTPPEHSLATASGSQHASSHQQKNTRNLSSQEGMIKGMSFGQRVGMDQICTFARSAGCWAGEGREGWLRNRVRLELLLNSFFNTAFSIISYPLDTPAK